MGDEDVEVDLAELLARAESVTPADAVLVVADHLEKRLGVEAARFWIADAAGRALLRMPDGERAPTTGSEAGRAWRTQRVVEGASVWVPVTVRGDALGVLEVRLGERDAHEEPLAEPLVTALRGVAHCLGYVVVANELHTDTFEVARRSQPYALSMEIQRRLLPNSFVCEGGSFALAGWLEPSATAGGDTFDYIASHDRLSVALVDAVGHDVRAAMLATLAVNAMRNARRDGAEISGQARAAHDAFTRYADPEQYATGVLLETPLHSPTGDVATGDAEPVRVRVVNAGHPPMRLVRDGRVTSVELTPDLPFGLDLPGLRHGFPAHEVEMRPGDRLVLITDGMYEGSADGFDLDAHLLATADRHPRNAVQDVGGAFREHVGRAPDDDATMLVLDWYGGTTGRVASGGADTRR